MNQGSAGSGSTARPTPPRRRRRFFGIGARISRAGFIAIAAAVFLLLVVAWAAATGAGIVGPLFLPSPGSVWLRMVSLAANGTLWQDAGVSLYRIIVGFLIATVMAMPIGVVIGSYRFWEAAIEPLVDFIRYMPVVAFVPLTILWSGTGDGQKFLIIWIGTFFQQVLLIMDNVKRVPSDFIDLGRTLGLQRPQDPDADRGALGLARDLGHAAHQPRLGLDLAGAWPSWWRPPRASAIASPCPSAISRPTPSSATSCSWACSA